MDTKEILKEKEKYLNKLLQIESFVRDSYSVTKDIYEITSKIKEFDGVSVHYDNDGSQIILCVTHKQTEMSFSQPSLHIHIKDGEIKTNKEEIEHVLCSIKKFE